MSVILQRGFVFALVLTALLTLGATDALAASRGASIGGASSLTFGLSLVTANQNDLNNVIDDQASAYPGNYGVKNLGSAYEFFAQYAMRFSGSMFGIVFRPSYFTQSTSGNCGGSNCSYKLTGLTLFPMLRLVPLENSFIKFFMQAGLGFGSLSVDVDQANGKASFNGNTVGEIAGIGVDFCFTGTHCLTIEGNVRYLPVERNTGSSSSGSPGGFSQVGGTGEIEYKNSDLSTSMSGIQGVLAYTLNF